MDYKAGMFIYALAFLLGVLSVQQMSDLPSLVTLFQLFAIFCLSIVGLLVVRKKYHLVVKKQYALTVVLISLLLLGFLFACYNAKQQLSTRLDETLVGENIVISGQILNIPMSSGKVQRFEFRIDGHRLLTAVGLQAAPFPKTVRLSWYYGETVNAGESWQFEVRLKPPHGFMNPGGFDYEAWLFQHGIDATGYVRKSSLNRREHSATASIDYFRQSLVKQIDAIARTQNQRLDAGEVNAFSLVKALAVGDKSSISSQQWRVLAATGTSHLMAISGLHVGLAALFAYVLIRRLVPVYIMKRMPAQHVALLAGLVAASLYALVAGLSIPTQRAVIMLFVLSLMLLIRRHHRPLDALGFALLLVLLIDPLAVLSAGFWFSFSAVAVIFISITSEQKQADVNVSFLSRLKVILKQWLRLQLMISLLLLPLSLFMFQQVSLVSPLANLILIPYVSFLVVPLVLLAIVFSFLWPYLSDLLFTLAATSLDFIWSFLSTLASLPFALWVRGDVGLIQLLATTIAMLLLFYTRKITGAFHKWRHKKPHKFAHGSVWFAAGLLFIPLSISSRSQFSDGDFQLTVLDVGQGSAAVIQTQNHVMVFDAGAKFSDRLNAGSGVVIPYLRSQGISKLDYLIISHGDADHIGGAQAILDEYPALFLVGRDIENLRSAKKQLCTAGLKWRWDGVDFVFLSPDNKNFPASKKGKRNNHSCVLQIRSGAGSVLLTGDIEKDVESWLLQKYGKKLASDILMVPHHGSKTSSSSAFIQMVDPEISFISAGYKNRYRLPSRKVVARYEIGERELLQTESSGAITIRLTAKTGFIIEEYREKASRYWQHVVKE